MHTGSSYDDARIEPAFEGLTSCDDINSDQRCEILFQEPRPLGDDLGTDGRVAEKVVVLARQIGQPLLLVGEPLAQLRWCQGDQQ